MQFLFIFNFMNSIFTEPSPPDYVPRLFGIFSLIFFIAGIASYFIGLHLESRKSRKKREGKVPRYPIVDEGKIHWYCTECDMQLVDTDKACPKCGIEFEI